MEDFQGRHAVPLLRNAHKSALMSNIANMQFGIQENILMKMSQTSPNRGREATPVQFAIFSRLLRMTDVNGMAIRNMVARTPM